MEYPLLNDADADDDDNSYKNIGSVINFKLQHFYLGFGFNLFFFAMKQAVRLLTGVRDEQFRECQLKMFRETQSNYPCDNKFNSIT